MPVGKILIVDDDQDVRYIIKLALEKEGLHIIEAENGIEAIKVLKEGDNFMNVPLIITDIRMPEMNGIEYIDYLKRQAPGIQIIVITGYPDPEIAARLKQIGVRGYLVKPFDLPKLIHLVNELIAIGKDFEY